MTEATQPNPTSAAIGEHLVCLANLLNEISISSPTGITSTACQEVAAILRAVASNVANGNAEAVIHDHVFGIDLLRDAVMSAAGLRALLHGETVGDAGQASNTIKVKRLHSDAKLPQYMTAGAACFDVCAVDGGVTRSGIAGTFDTGLAFEVPKDHVMLVFSRSGHGFNHDVRLANCVGVLDSDYRGELKVRLTRDSFGDFSVNEGDRIAQCLVLPAKQWAIMEVDELSDTVRGTGGFGSTGA